MDIMIKSYGLYDLYIKKSPIDRAIVQISKQMDITIKNYGLNDVCIKKSSIHKAIV